MTLGDRRALGEGSLVGPHAGARLRLLDKNLRSELVEFLAVDADPVIAERAEGILAGRGLRPQPVESTNY